MAENSAPLDPASITGSTSLGIRTVAIQGELGSFSHEAALVLAPGATIVPCSVSADVFRRLLGEIDAAVIPIENSLAGSVLEHYDLLLANDVRIEQEHLLRVRHNLIAPPETTVDALEQCRGFFRRHPQLQPVPFYDTAGSVKQVMSELAGGAAAIASRQAAVQYGGVLLEEGLEDNPENYTRFLLIRPAGLSGTGSTGGTQTRAAASEANGGGANKVSICFAVENRPGSLVAALEVFARQQINLTRLESRPVPGSPWQYIFYADYQMEQPGQADTALALLVEHCSMVKELGRYPAAGKPIDASAAWKAG